MWETSVLLSAAGNHDKVVEEDARQWERCTEVFHHCFFKQWMKVGKCFTKATQLLKHDLKEIFFPLVEDQNKSHGAGPGSAQWNSRQSSDGVRPVPLQHPVNSKWKDKKYKLIQVRMRHKLVCWSPYFFYANHWSKCVWLAFCLCFVSDLREWMMAKCLWPGRHCWSKYKRCENTQIKPESGLTSTDCQCT